MLTFIDSVPYSCCRSFQVIYELKAGGVDERRLVGVKLEKLAEGESGMSLRSPGSLLV